MAKDRDEEIKRISEDLESLKDRAKKANLRLVVSLISIAALNVNYGEPSRAPTAYQDNINYDDESES
jgi:hypothetical protein